MQHTAVPILFLTAAASVGFSAPSALDRQFEQTVRPYIGKYCAGCHSGEKAAAQLDLKTYTTKALVTQDFPRWALIMERMEAKEMPPKPMPSLPLTPAIR